MNPRDVINFLRSPTGAMVIFLVLLAIGFGLVMGFRKPPEPPLTPPKPDLDKPQVVETIRRDISRFNPPRDEESEDKPAPQEPEETKKKAELPPINLFAAAPVQAQGNQLSEDYAPFGRLIRCELVVTVDSSSIQTPIIGLITDDVWHNGRLIVPAGTEVHGQAQVDRVRERIASSGNWTFVWQNGQELSVSGIALDREQEPNDYGWGLTDGSAGLRGYLVKSDSLAEIKLFAATFLSGAAGALTDREQTIFGSRVSPTLQNAAPEGAQAVLETYAQQVFETIQRDGFYVRVPAGKQFYLYTTQTIDRAQARVGGASVQQAPLPEEDPQPRYSHREVQPPTFTQYSR